jgi:epoxide hydrolase 4
MVVETRQAFLRNLSTSWLEAGKNNDEILVFIHGYPDGPEVWSEQIKSFSKQYHVVCPYNRGTFASEGGRDLHRFSTESISLDFLEILKIVDPKGNKPIRVVGHDLGGAIAWKLASYLGQRLSSLVVINSLSIEQMTKRFFLRPKQWLRSWYIYPFLVPKLSDHFVGRFSKQLKLESPFPKATLKLYRAFAREALQSLNQKPARIQAPTLVIWGNRDPFLLPPTLDELEPYAHHLTVRIIEGNHWVFREKPKLIHEILISFFSQGGRHARLT